jgi:hypothetical protein
METWENPQVFEVYFLEWAESLAKDTDIKMVSLDGKTIGQASIHFISAIFLNK